MTATDSTSGSPAASAGGGLSEARRAEFEQEVADLRVKTSTNQIEARNGKVGLGLAIAGIVLAFVSYVGSINSSGFQAQVDFLILAVAGGAVTVLGSIVWLRNSLGSLLRLWLVRLVYEQRDQTDRLLQK